MPEYSHEAGVTNVSEAQQAKNDGWGHRTEVAENALSKERQAGVSKRVRDRQMGEALDKRQREALFGYRGFQRHEHEDDNDQDHDWDVDPKDTKEKYSDKYGDMVSEEMKSKLRQKRIEAMKEQASDALDSTTKN